MLLYSFLKQNICCSNNHKKTFRFNYKKTQDEIRKIIVSVKYAPAYVLCSYCFERELIPHEITEIVFLIIINIDLKLKSVYTGFHVDFCYL